MPRSGKQEIVETHRRVFEVDKRQRVENEVIGRDRAVNDL
jgi:hypothetical protein